MILKDQVVVVTGGSRGIGQAIALLFAAEGAQIVVAARDPLACQDVADMICARGGHALAIPTDVSDENQVTSLANTTLASFGRIDGLVNSAGVGQLTPMPETSLQTWRRCLDVNLTGTFLCCRAVWPSMAKQKSGRILNISSGTAKFPRAGWSAYCAAKAGVLALTEVLSLEGLPHGIRVYVLCPGATATEMRRSNFPNDEPTLLLGPKDIAKAALFFFTDMAEHVYHAQLDVRMWPRGTGPQ